MGSNSEPKINQKTRQIIYQKTTQKYPQNESPRPFRSCSCLDSVQILKKRPVAEKFPKQLPKITPNGSQRAPKGRQKRGRKLYRKIVENKRKNYPKCGPKKMFNSAGDPPKTLPGREKSEPPKESQKRAPREAKGSPNGANWSQHGAKMDPKWHLRRFLTASADSKRFQFSITYLHPPVS